MSLRIKQAYEGDEETVILANAIEIAKSKLDQMLTWKKLSQRAREHVNEIIGDMNGGLNKALSVTAQKGKNDVK